MPLAIADCSKQKCTTHCIGTQCDISKITYYVFAYIISLNFAILDDVNINYCIININVSQIIIVLS